MVKRKMRAVKGVTSRARTQDLEPNFGTVDRMVSTYSTQSPAEFAFEIVRCFGHDMASYDDACVRVERFLRNRPTKRMPAHIRHKFFVKRLVEMCIARLFPHCHAPTAS